MFAGLPQSGQYPDAVFGVSKSSISVPCVGSVGIRIGYVVHRVNSLAQLFLHQTLYAIHQLDHQHERMHLDQLIALR